MKIAANIASGIFVIFITLWVPTGTGLWIISHWKPEVADLAHLMLGIGGVLVTCATLTFAFQATAPEEEQS
jgi:hypothetical protein